ncbi:hypothetical protein VNO80_02501 [Phaseolus coccineus]|uniref:Uncharacterized protein n=1 Tax=Phaseolus coccineus TaxID=3886 RepID=A0AAN9NQE5_PHACN
MLSNEGEFTSYSKQGPSWYSWISHNVEHMMSLTLVFLIILATMIVVVMVRSLWLPRERARRGGDKIEECDEPHKGAIKMFLPTSLETADDMVEVGREGEGFQKLG